jgi:hypothetical protein
MSNSLTRTQEKKAKPSAEEKEVKTSTAHPNVQLIDGMIVVLPKEEAIVEPTTEEIQMLIEKSKGIVVSKVESEEGVNGIPVPEIQNVYDTESAEKSRIYNQHLSEQNKQRAEKAQAHMQLKKSNGSIVVSTEGNVSDDTEIFNYVEGKNNT